MSVKHLVLFHSLSISGKSSDVVQDVFDVQKDRNTVGRTDGREIHRDSTHLISKRNKQTWQNELRSFLLLSLLFSSNYQQPVTAWHDASLISYTSLTLPEVQQPDTLSSGLWTATRGWGGVGGALVYQWLCVLTETQKKRECQREWCLLLQVRPPPSFCPVTVTFHPSAAVFISTVLEAESSGRGGVH